MVRQNDHAQARERIAKAMARAGVCSRRDAEALIVAGRVALNGAPVASPATTVTPQDRIMLDGQPLPARERTRLFLYHKPAGLVATRFDPQGRPTIFEALPPHLPRLIGIGRLDIGTEGLLLLTNDGGLARTLELPQTQWVRRYRVRAYGRVKAIDLDRLQDGITIAGIHYGAIEAALEREQGSNAWLAFAIREGKNREVKNVLAHLGLQVNRLIRIAFGPFELGHLPVGAIEEVATANLRRELGEAIVARAGCDLSFSPALAGQVAATKGRTEVAARRGDRFPASPKKQPADEKPRPRRGHAWRQKDAPLRRHYRGSRREDLKIGDGAEREKRAGLLTDRKGRRILVERFGEAAPAADAPAKAPARPARPARPVRPSRPPRDRAGGPRPSWPKPSQPRPSQGGPSRPGSSRRKPSRPTPPRSQRPGKPPRRPPRVH